MVHKFLKQVLRFSSLSCLTFFWLLTSCGPKIEYRRVESNDIFSFEIKTEDGRRSWGLVRTIPNHDTGERSRCIPCEYDSIYAVEDIEDLYIAIKDGKKFAYNAYNSNRSLFDGKPVNKITFREDLYEKYSNSTFGNLYHQAHTSEGIYYFRGMDKYHDHNFCFGPYENFFYGGAGYAYKKNGKWGACLKKTISSTSNRKDEVRYIPFLSPVYDAIIQIMGPQPYWLVKENGVWKTILTSTGEEIKKPQSLIQLFLNRPILKSKNFNSDHYTNDLDYGYKRIGGEEYGAIRIRDQYRAY